MPGWHEATLELQRSGKLQMIGIIQEQHPARANLFMQWKRMDWPLMVDSLNLLDVDVVPVTLLIDEHGIVRKVNPRLDLEQLSREFLDLEFDPPAKAPLVTRHHLDFARMEAKNADTAAAWSRYAEALLLWSNERGIPHAVDALATAVERDPGDAGAWFRYGVALRARYDSALAEDGDFQAAVDAWSRALELDPNNYIRRRRIQQYGPRLSKPYPFYDWVGTARREIVARGELPLPLRVEPGGAEAAHPQRKFEETIERTDAPDPEGKILRDAGKLIAVESTVVPAAIEPGAAARVHLVFRPRSERDAYWNNDAGDMQLWISPPAGTAVDRRRLSSSRPAAIVSAEPRRFEFELRVDADRRPGALELPAYALYYVCETETGACLYRRQDLSLELTVRD